MILTSGYVMTTAKKHRTQCRISHVPGLIERNENSGMKTMYECISQV